MIKRLLNKFYSLVLGYYPGSIEDFSFKLDVKNWYFWEIVKKGKWEPETFKVISNSLKKDSTFVDLGAWIGPTSLYASKVCKKVICFEPDPVAFHALQKNISTNHISNITAFNAAISPQTAIANLSSFGGDLGDSMSSLLNESNDESNCAPVICLSWEIIEKQLEDEDIGLIKIDVEGSEFLLLPVMEPFLASRKPDLWLSFHVPFLEKPKQKESYSQIVEILQKCYTNCYDEEINPIGFDHLLDEKYLNDSHSFLFTC